MDNMVNGITCPKNIYHYECHIISLFKGGKESLLEKIEKEGEAAVIPNYLQNDFKGMSFSKKDYETFANKKYLIPFSTNIVPGSYQRRDMPKAVKENNENNENNEKEEEIPKIKSQQNKNENQKIKEEDDDEWGDLNNKEGQANADNKKDNEEKKNDDKMVEESWGEENNNQQNNSNNFFNCFFI